ncbi:heat shock protein 30 [Coniochaeta sp. 2T2.1]|nr:heat shock protein 30 [Coniochaeta sp. 2T2.1]
MPAFILARANDALNVNPPPAGTNHLTVGGSDWLWAVTAVFILSWLAMSALVWFARGGERIFHYLFISALAVGSIVYFAQASDLGWSVVAQANNHGRGIIRQIFWAKYILWVVEFPVVVIALGLLSGVSWATIAYNVFMSWVWVISYLVGAFTTTNYKWGFFAFGTGAWLVLAVHTLRDGSVGAKRLGVTRDHSALSGWVNLLWLLYPIAWGLSDGGNRIGVTGSFVFFGILDFLLIPVTAWAFMFLARRWDYNNLNIAFTQYGRVQSAPGTFPEKNTTAAAPATATPATGVTV